MSDAIAKALIDSKVEALEKAKRAIDDLIEVYKDLL